MTLTPAKWQPPGYFNSCMVRLTGNQDINKELMGWGFQFLHGTISDFQRSLLQTFQFLHGTINSFVVVATVLKSFLFQFLHGAINGNRKMKRTNVLTIFQFQNGEINSDVSHAMSSSICLFQFLHGTINGLPRYGNKTPIQNFNSYMVRLMVKCINIRQYLEMHFNSYIVRLMDGAFWLINTSELFQFLHGAINGVLL